MTIESKKTLRFTSGKNSEWLRCSCILGDSEEPAIYLETPCEYESRVSSRHDFLLVLAIHRLMEKGGVFYIDGSVDATLMRNLEEYSRIWSMWCPQLYKPVAFEAKPTPPFVRDHSTDETLVAFSGGVDACFTLYGHEHRLFGASSRQVKTCIMLHGADIKLSQQAEFDTAFLKAKETLTPKGIELIPVRTNYRMHPGHNWEHCFFSVVAAGLMMFSERYAHASCGAELPILPPLQIPWGMNYITDHLLFPSYFEIYQAGKAMGRTERCRHISHDTALMKDLRVCWQHDAQGGNCGVCEKCQRTMLNFMAAGYTGHLPFKSSFSLDHFKLGPLWDEERQAYYKDILSYNDNISHALSGNIRQAIEERLLRSEQNKPLLRRRLCKAMICLAPIPSWRRKLRRKYL